MTEAEGVVEDVVVFVELVPFAVDVGEVHVEKVVGAEVSPAEGDCLPEHRVVRPHLAAPDEPAPGRALHVEAYSFADG